MSVNTSSSTKESDSDEREIHLLPISQLIPVLMVIIVLILTAVIGNLLVIISYLKDKALQTTYNMYIFNLAIADMFLGLISMGLYIVYSITYWHWFFGRAMCKVFLCVDYTLCLETVLLMIVISLDRLILITTGVRYHQRETRKVACIKITATWIFAFALYGPAIIGWDYFEGKSIVEDGDCTTEFSLNYEFTLATSIVEFVIPFVSIVVLNILIYTQIRKRNKIFGKTNISLIPITTATVNDPHPNVLLKRNISDTVDGKNTRDVHGNDADSVGGKSQGDIDVNSRYCTDGNTPYRVRGTITSYVDLNSPYSIDGNNSSSIGGIIRGDINVNIPYSVDVNSPYRLDVNNPLRVDTNNPYRVDVNNPYRVDVNSLYRTDGNNSGSVKGTTLNSISQYMQHSVSENSPYSVGSNITGSFSENNPCSASGNIQSSVSSNMPSGDGKNIPDNVVSNIPCSDETSSSCSGVQNNPASVGCAETVDANCPCSVHTSSSSTDVNKPYCVGDNNLDSFCANNSRNGPIKNKLDSVGGKNLDNLDAKTSYSSVQYKPNIARDSNRLSFGATSSSSFGANSSSSVGGNKTDSGSGNTLDIIKGKSPRHVCRKSPGTVQKDKHERKAAKALTLLVIVFAICWTPYTVSTVVLAFCEPCVHKYVYESFNWLLWSKSCINPFLYAYTNERFRENFKKLLFIFCKKNKCHNK